MPFPYQDAYYKNVDRGNDFVFPLTGYKYNADMNNTKTFFHFQDTRYENAGNQILFPLPKYQYNAYRNNK